MADDSDDPKATVSKLVRSLAGAALVRIRWDAATAEERTAQAELMNAARWKGHKRKWPKRKPKR